MHFAFVDNEWSFVIIIIIFSFVSRAFVLFIFSSFYWLSLFESTIVYFFSNIFLKNTTIVSLENCFTIFSFLTSVHSIQWIFALKWIEDEGRKKVKFMFFSSRVKHNMCQTNRSHTRKKSNYELDQNVFESRIDRFSCITTID